MTDFMAACLIGLRYLLMAIIAIEWRIVRLLWN
jgi:hypothetical protein